MSNADDETDVTWLLTDDEPPPPFLRRWAGRPDAADTSVRLPDNAFLRRWLTGRADDEEV